MVGIRARAQAEDAGQLPRGRDLYLRPALGHIRLADLRGDHFRDLAAAMRLINRPEADDDQTDLLRRLLGARATRDGRRV